MDRRIEFRKGLSPHYLLYFDALCSLLPLEWQPVSGLRSLEYQAVLYAQGRTEPGEIVTNALPGKSMHNYGLASDWAYFYKGRYTPLKPEDSLWKEYVDACEKVGVRCITWEKPHNELSIRTPVSKLFEAWIQGKQQAVDALIQKELNNEHDPIAS